MPEINGITQVDIPGIISAYDEQKRQRLQDLYLKQKMDRDNAAAQKEMETDAATRAAIKPRKPPSQGSAVSGSLVRLSQLRNQGQSNGVAAAAGVGGTRGVADLYLSGSPAPVSPTVAPASVTPAPAPAPLAPTPDLPHPPSHLLPDVEQTDDGIDFSPGLALDPEGLDRLAHINPKAAYDLQKMDEEARARAFKRISDDVEFTGRIIGAVRAAPKDQRQARYQQVRADMAARGFNGMPERWDEEQADTLQRMGLTAM